MVNLGACRRIFEGIAGVNEDCEHEHGKDKVHLRHPPMVGSQVDTFVSYLAD